MSPDVQIREAERAGDTLRLARLLVRFGFVKREGANCIHCGEAAVGYGIWGEHLTGQEWDELNEIGLPYKCRWLAEDYGADEDTGCGGIYVIQW